MRHYLARQIAGLEEPKQPGDEEFAAVLGELAAFKDERGWIPDWRSKEAAEARLGLWLLAQQGAEQRGVLCGLRRSKLEELLGRGWSWPT